MDAWRIDLRDRWIANFHNKIGDSESPEFLQTFRHGLAQEFSIFVEIDVFPLLVVRETEL